MAPTILNINNLQLLKEGSENHHEGFLLPVDKPYRWSSFDAVRRVKYLLQKKWHTKNIKIGHAGTLDPLATGLLILCIGKAATTLADTLQSKPKEYIAEFTLGASTPSFDREHPIDELFEYKHITLEAIKSVVASMAGEQEQMPPLFSAKSVEGKRAYNLARQGVTEAATEFATKLKPQIITIYKSELLGWQNISGSQNQMRRLSDKEAFIDDTSSQKSPHEPFTEKKWGASAEHESESELLSPNQIEKLPRVTLRIACSKGTYIRSIARDFGAALKSGAYMSQLRRSECGGIKIEDVVTFSDFERIMF